MSGAMARDVSVPLREKCQFGFQRSIARLSGPSKSRQVTTLSNKSHLNNLLVSNSCAKRQSNPCATPTADPNAG